MLYLAVRLADRTAASARRRVSAPKLLFHPLSLLYMRKQVSLLGVVVGSAALAVGAVDHKQGKIQTAFRIASSLAVEGHQWDIEPDIDTTGHHLFNSVSSLLQLWPNTVVRPGECCGQGVVDARHESFLPLTTITGA